MLLTKTEKTGEETSFEASGEFKSSVMDTMGFLGGSVIKKLSAMQDMWVWFPGEGSGNLLQYSCVWRIP